MKLSSMILTLALLSMFSLVMANGNVIIDENFDNVASIDDLGFELQEGGTSEIKIGEFPSFIDKSLQIVCHDDGEARATLPVNLDNGLLVVEWDWYATSWNEFQIEGELAAGGADDVCHIRAREDHMGYITGKSPATDIEDTLAVAPRENWYNMKVVFDIDQGMVSYYVDDTLRVTDSPKKQRFLAYATGILWKSTGGEGSTYINNLKIIHYEMEEQVLVDKNFDGETTGEDPADFVLDEGGSSDISVADFPSFIDKSIKLDAEGDGECRLTYPLNIDHGKLIVEWDWYYTSYRFQLEGELEPGGSDDVVDITGREGTITAVRGRGASVDLHDTLVVAPNENWYKIKFVMDVDHDGAMYFVDDTLRKADLLKKERMLAYSTGILWKNGGDNECFINNLKITHRTLAEGAAVESKQFADVPESYSLGQNYPNPFNPATTINYTLKKPSEVTLTVYDILGHKVRTLTKAKQQAGFYNVTWDATDENGHRVANGVYIYQLKANDGEKEISRARKMMLLK